MRINNLKIYSLTFPDYFDSWLSWRKKGRVSPTTYQKYLDLSKNLHQIADGVKLRKLSRQKYQEIITKYGQTHELATVKNALQMLNSSLRDAEYDNLIKKAPIYKVEAVSTKISKEKRNYLDLKESNILAQFLIKNKSPYSSLCLLALKTGMRYGECLGITPSDINLQNNKLNINKQFDYKNQTGFTPTKNKSSNRTVTLDLDTITTLTKLTKNCPKDTSIFINLCRNQNLSTYNDAINKFLLRTCKTLKITPISFHGLRHTHASTLIVSGVSLQSIAARLGHSNTATTQKVYLHLLKELEEKDNAKIIEAINYGTNQILTNYHNFTQIAKLTDKLLILSSDFAVKTINSKLLINYKDQTVFILQPVSMANLECRLKFCTDINLNVLYRDLELMLFAKALKLLANYLKQINKKYI